MTQCLNTEEGSGENGILLSPSSKPTLKEFISQELGQNADTVYSKLTSELGITKIDSLIFMDLNDLNQLCAELKLSFGDKLKFKSAINQLQQLYKSQANVQNNATISPKDQSMIDKMDLAITQSFDIQHLFEAHFNSIEDHIADKKTKIHTQIQNGIKELQNREKNLYQQLDEWKLTKLEGINTTIQNIVEYNKELKAKKKVVESLLSISESNSMVNETMRAMACDAFDGMFKNDKYKKYQQTDLVNNYLRENTKLIDIVFKQESVSKYGEVKKDINSDLFVLPSITLNYVRKTTENNDRYKAVLNWKFESNEQRKTCNFIIKYRWDEEKKDNDSMDWGALDGVVIKQEKSNEYSCDITTNLNFNKKYNFMVEKIIDKPIHLVVQSNIKSITIIKVDEFKLNPTNAKAIPLKIHSHKGHADSVSHPSNMLNSESGGYWSKKNNNKDDWITFSIDNDNRYYPTKLALRSDGDDYSPKRFVLKIGSVDSNEWINLSEQIFVFKAIDENFQTFDLDIINNMKNNETVSKWKSMKSKQFKQFKLEILDNYGGSQIIIREFKIFGVQN